MNTSSECPNCRNDNYKYIERTRQGVRYRVWVCRRCRNVVRREIEDADSDNGAVIPESIMRSSDNVHGSSDSKQAR